MIPPMILWGRRLGFNPAWTRSDRVVLGLAALCAALDAALLRDASPKSWAPVAPVLYVICAAALGLARAPLVLVTPERSPYRIPPSPPREPPRGDELFGMRGMLWPFVVLNLLAVMLFGCIALLLKSCSGSMTFIA
jgi:hypothetical protein